MTRPPTPLEQIGVHLVFAGLTRLVLTALDRRRRPARCGSCLEVDLAASKPGQPSHVCRFTLMAPGA